MSDEKRDRYISFDNIDCYQNTRAVLDALTALFKKHPDAKNVFWDRFERNMPDDYNRQVAREGCRDILYLVCSNVFYLYDIFEEYDWKVGTEALEVVEEECC